jgi:hypothetical protein
MPGIKNVARRSTRDRNYFPGGQDWPSRPITMVYPFASGSAAHCG